MKMSQAIEKYIEQVNKLAALSDKVKLVPLNEWVTVVEVIEGNAATWPDKKFLDNFFRGDENEWSKHINADLMLFTQGACRGNWFSGDCAAIAAAEGTDADPCSMLKNILDRTNTSDFKLVLLKASTPESAQYLWETSEKEKHSIANEKIKLFDCRYILILNELFKIFAEYDDTDEIPLDIPIALIPSEDILWAELNVKIYYKQVRQLELEKARAEERKKVIADLSHHIKNLVRSVIDPLELLKEDDQEHRAIIDNALRGVNLIREIVNAMNLSFSGSTEGIIYDFNNPSHDSMQLQDILISGLRNAVSNMFDGKYFKQFGYGYFPDRDIFIEAKQQWQKLDISNIGDLKALLEQYFFKLDLKLQNANIPVGNQNSSATKLLIMFQEIMLNAVKYSSFVPLAERKITVSLKVEMNKVSLEVENTFNPKSSIKSSGLGLTIINNFANLLGAKVDIDKDNGHYKIKIEFNTNQ